jgi:hypothetical protein
MDHIGEFAVMIGMASMECPGWALSTSRVLTGCILRPKEPAHFLKSR